MNPPGRGVSEWIRTTVLDLIPKLGYVGNQASFSLVQFSKELELEGRPSSHNESQKVIENGLFIPIWGITNEGYI